MDDAAHTLGIRFYSALLAGGWPAIRALLHDDATWTLPGDNSVSGTAAGADAVIAQLQKVAGYGVHFELLHILTSREHMALSQHNTARRNGHVVLDEHLATVFRLRDGRIAEAETFASDVPGMNAFFI